MRIIFICTLLLSTLLTSPALASSTTFLSGLVTLERRPVANASVTVTGNNIVQRTLTGTDGHFRFNALSIGTYLIEVRSGAGRTDERIDLSSEGASVSLDLAPKVIGNVSVIRPPTMLHGSGADLVLTAGQLTRMPAAGNFPELLIQLPGAARGANGVVHLNGDHGDINYIVDGVPVPQALNRIVGTEFDPNDLAFAEVLQGAYPAQYGGRFASIVNIGTREGTGPAGFNGDIEAGSYADLDATLGYHAPLGKGFLALAVRNQHSDRGLDPPDFDSPHNSASNADQLLRYTLPNGNDSFNLTLTHSFHTYQIPNDVQGGQPASTDDNEWQDDTFVSMQYHHAIGSRGAVWFGPGFKRSQIRDFGDPANDFAYGEALNSAGACSSSSCGYSLASDKTAYDYIFTTDYVLRSGAHEIRAGALYDATNVNKRYAVTLQPNNFLAPIFTPAMPDAPYTVTDAAPNTGASQSAYVQDSWKMGNAYQLDYGLRADAFQIGSTGAFSDGFSQFSPRVKLTRNFGPRANVYVYYGRFFTPFSFENVSPVAAQTLNLPLRQGMETFDLKPQRDSSYEVGAHLPLGPGDLGIRVMQKNATDLIDDTQVGVTNLHQDMNYQQGRIATQTLYYQVPLRRNGRFYVSANHTYAKNKGCETQLLAPCFGSPGDWTPADHEQPWGATTGMLLNDAHDGWFSFDGEYGSGLSSAACPPGTPGFCHQTPHVTFDVEKGLPIARAAALTLRIRNLLNDRYYVTLLNAQGTHFAAPRTFEAGVRFGK